MKNNHSLGRNNNLRAKLSLDTPVHLQLRKNEKQNLIQINVRQIQSPLIQVESKQISIIKPHKQSICLIKPKEPQPLSTHDLKTQKKANILAPISSMHRFPSKVSLQSIEDKQNTAQFPNQNQSIQGKATIADNSDVKVRHRSRTTTPSMLKIRKNSSNFQSLEQTDQCKQFYVDIQQSLKKQCLIQPYHSLYLNIRRQKFHQIIVKIIKTLFSPHSKNQYKSDIFKNSLQSIKNNILKKEYNNSKCFIFNKVFTFEYSSKKYANDWNKSKANLDSLQQQKNRLQDEVAYNLKMLADINQTVKRKLLEVVKLQECENEKGSKIKQQEHCLQMLEQKLQNMKKYLSEVDQQYQKMINYIETQDKNKLIKLISKDYIDIQTELYDYAVYLQHNQLANDIHYQPHPFTQMEELILEEMKVLNKSIITNKEPSTNEKNAKMRDFILYAMDKFKKKDADMFKLNQFKTKCALTFISKMKKWLNNWELKQEYLVSLKKEYAAITLAINKLLEEMACKDYKEVEKGANEDIKKVAELLQQLQVNFGLGNSFY